MLNKYAVILGVSGYFNIAKILKMQVKLNAKSPNIKGKIIFLFL